MLVSHVSYAGGNYVDPSRHHLTRQELQGDYQKQVRGTAYYLLWKRKTFYVSAILL
jgi:hypothetical protein